MTPFEPTILSPHGIARPLSPNPASQPRLQPHRVTAQRQALLSRCLPRDNGNIAPPHRHGFGQKADERLIGRPFHRGGCHAQLQHHAAIRTAPQPVQAIAMCARGQPHPKLDAVRPCAPGWVVHAAMKPCPVLGTSLADTSRYPPIRTENPHAAGAARATQARLGQYSLHPSFPKRYTSPVSATAISTGQPNPGGNLSEYDVFEK